MRTATTMGKTLILAVTVLVMSLFVYGIPAAQRFRAMDPGIRSGDPGAGEPLAGLTSRELVFFEVAKHKFEDPEEVADGIGPRMNLNSCVGCHSHPATGGSSPAENPQVAFARRSGELH